MQRLSTAFLKRDLWVLTSSDTLNDPFSFLDSSKSSLLVSTPTAAGIHVRGNCNNPGADQDSIVFVIALGLSEW